MNWLWILLAIVYILSPYDLLPDFIPLRGWIDDGVVLFFLYRYIAKLLARRRYTAAHDQQQSAPNEKASAQTGGNHNQQTEIKTPHEVLGVSSAASKKEIHRAYLKLANQYHPDKVAHLGPEFQELADKKFKEIQQAYQSITKP